MSDGGPKRNCSWQLAPSPVLLCCPGASRRLAQPIELPIAPGLKLTLQHLLLRPGAGRGAGDARPRRHKKAIERDEEDLRVEAYLGAERDTVLRALPHRAAHQVAAYVGGVLAPRQATDWRWMQRVPQRRVVFDKR